MDLAATKHSHHRRDPVQSAFKPKLADDLENVAIRGEPMVIILFDLGVPDRERHGETPELCAALEERYTESGAGEAVRCAQARKAAPDDGDVGLRRG